MEGKFAKDENVNDVIKFALSHSTFYITQETFDIFKGV